MDFDALGDERFRVNFWSWILYVSYCVEFTDCVVSFVQDDAQELILYLLDPADVCLSCCNSDLVAVCDYLSDA